MRRWLVCVLLSGLVCGCKPKQAQAPPLEGTVAPQPTALPTAPEYRLAFVDMEDRLHLLTPDYAGAEPIAQASQDVLFSRDGLKAAYVGPHLEVGWLDLATGQTAEIAPAKSAHGFGLAIAPDGSAVAYGTKAGTRVWRPGAPEVELAEPRAVSGLAWSPDGSRLAIGAMGESWAEHVDGGLWLWDGTGEARRLARPLKEDWGCSRDIVWSPDGQWIAWTRGAGDHWSGDLVRADGSDLRRFDLGAGPVEWLPDSSGLLVQVHIEAGAFRVGYYDVTQKTLTAFGGETEEAVGCLSPDGGRALILLRRGRTPGFIVDLRTMAQQQWGEPVDAVAATWGAHGSIAVLVDLGGGYSAVYVCDSTGKRLGQYEANVWSTRLKWVKVGQAERGGQASRVGW